MKVVLALFFAVLSNELWAGEINTQRALFNYQMSCQGCHAPDGSGANAVPRVRDQLGFFLSSNAGREYLVRVPGSATSALSDPELAEVLNWMMREFAGASAPPSFSPYTAEEVAELRQHPLNEVVQYRAQLVVEIARANAGE
jgi:mono/diheme cytochrome c family protein